MQKIEAYRTLDGRMFDREAAAVRHEIRCLVLEEDDSPDQYVNRIIREGDKLCSLLGRLAQLEPKPDAPKA